MTATAAATLRRSRSRHRLRRGRWSAAGEDAVKEIAWECQEGAVKRVDEPATGGSVRSALGIRRLVEHKSRATGDGAA